MTYLLVSAVVILLSLGIVYFRSGNRMGVLVLPVGRHRRLKIHMESMLWLTIATVCILFGGLRYYVGTDYESYIDIFNQIHGNSTRYTFSVESGYILLNRLVGLVTANPQAIMIVTSAIIVVFYLARIQASSAFIPFSVYVFFSLFTSSFNTIRQGIAIAICVFALEEIRSKRWGRSAALFLVAMLFHKTSMFMLAVYILCRCTYSIAGYGIISAGMGLLFLARGRLYTLLLDVFYTNYQGLSTYSDTPNISLSPVQVFQCTMYLALCVIYYKPLLKKHPGNILYVNLSFVFLLCCLLGTWLPLWERMVLYLQAPFLLVIPEVISCEENKWVRRFYYFMIWGSMFFYWVLALRGMGYQTVFGR